MTEPDPFDVAHLYRTHSPMIRRALKQLGIGDGQLDDATQEVFMVLHRRIHDFDKTRSLKNWLWGIAKGVASTHRRSERRRSRLQAAWGGGPSAHERDRDQARREAVHTLARVLGQLDEPMCAVFIMADVQGYSGPEIADRLAVNINTVYSRLRSARRHLNEAARPRERCFRDRLSLWIYGPVQGWAMAGAMAMSVGLSAFEYEPRLAFDSIVPVAQVQPTRMSTAEPRHASRDHGLRAKEAVMIHKPLAVLTLAATLVAPTTALAGTARTKAKATRAWRVESDGDDSHRVAADASHREYVFDDEKLEGEVLTTDDLFIPLRARAKHPSLIQIRGHFNDELVRFATDV